MKEAKRVNIIENKEKKIGNEICLLSNLVRTQEVKHGEETVRILQEHETQGCGGTL